MKTLNAQIAELIEEARVKFNGNTLAGEGSDRFFENAVYCYMGKIAKDRAVDLLHHEGYIRRPLPDTDVTSWYDNASEGEREHMANKLAKAGYPENGKHSEYGIQKAAIKRFIADINEDIEELI